MDELEKHIESQRSELDGELPNANLWEKLNGQLNDEAIEEAIAGHRELLNSEMPSPKIWQAIEAQLESETKIVRMVPIRRVWQVAASVAILLSAVFAWHTSRISNETPAVAKADWRTAVPELATAEQYYRQVIAEKQLELQQFDAKQFGLAQQDFSAEMTHLDSAYQQLELELLDSQSNERVVSAMIENLQMRMAMLSRQLEMLRQLKEQKQVVALEVSI